MSATTAWTLPTGVHMQPLTPYIDARGRFLELFRNECALPVELGRASVGLRDLRRGSPTEGLACLVELSGERPAAIAIPHGVAHGFFFHEFSLHIYAVSRYWDHADELGRPDAGDSVADADGTAVRAGRGLPVAQ